MTKTLLIWSGQVWTRIARHRRKDGQSEEHVRFQDDRKRLSLTGRQMMLHGWHLKVLILFLAVVHRQQLASRLVYLLSQNSLDNHLPVLFAHFNTMLLSSNPEVPPRCGVEHTILLTEHPTTLKPYAIA